MIFRTRKLIKPGDLNARGTRYFLLTYLFSKYGPKITAGNNLTINTPAIAKLAFA